MPAIDSPPPPVPRSLLALCCSRRTLPTPSPNHDVCCVETFPEGWSFDGVSCGTPGEFPDGADYGVGFQGRASAYVVGYLASGVSNRQEL